MVAQTLYDLLDFNFEFLTIFWSLWIYGACMGKILPYHDAIGIAELIKLVVFIDIAAPAAYTVTAYIGQHWKYVGQARSITCVKCIHRNPVGTHPEYLFTVYVEAKLAAAILVSGGSAEQLDSAHTVLEAIFINSLSPIIKSNFDIIKVWFTIIARPPEFTVAYSALNLASSMPQSA